MVAATIAAAIASGRMAEVPVDPGAFDRRGDVRRLRR